MEKAKEFQFEDTKKANPSSEPYYFLYRFLGRFFAKQLYYTRITPNQVTIFGFLSLIVAAYLFYRADYVSIIFAAILLQISWVSDATDGRLARIKGLQSDYGGWLDGISGCYGWALVFIGITLGVYSKMLQAHVLILGFLAVLANFIKKYTQISYLTTFDFAHKHGKKIYKKMGFLMFFRYSGIFIMNIFTLGAIINKMYWALILCGIYGPIYSIVQNTVFTLKIRKEFLKKRKKK